MPKDVSLHDVFIDANGKFVSGDHPSAAIQLAAKGVEIPYKTAQRHGLEADGTPIKKATVKEPESLKEESAPKPKNK